jgi:putative ABC transport system substrate-binding protein
MTALMLRREFITLLGGAAAWPLVARAQQRPMPVVGLLHSGTPETNPNPMMAFRKGLSETGFVEGQSVTIEYRWGQNDLARLPELAADLVRRRVAVIATPNGLPAYAAKAATTTIPVVFGTAIDPVQAGLVASLNRPGGNLTGFASMGTETTAKRFGLLRELAPRAVRIGVLVNLTNSAAEPTLAELRAAAATVDRHIEVLAANASHEIDSAFGSLGPKLIDALFVVQDALFNSRRVQIATLGTRHALPVIYSQRDIVEVGGLMSYAASLPEQYRQVGIYVGRILKGEKPADLPVMQPTKFEFVINLQTARALGIEVPPTLLALADEVIE